MTKDQAYQLFESMIIVATNALFTFTQNQQLTTEKKADTSLVTACDKEIDTVLSKISYDAGLQVVSEEGEHTLQIVESGNYITIDPIDGTLGYIDYVNYALEHGGIETFLQKDLGGQHDFCLLLGIVENGIAQYGCCYNFVTHEKILIDGNDKNNFIRGNNIRNYNQEYVAYLDQRESNDPIATEIKLMQGVSVIKQATVGLKSLYTVLNPHTAAIMPHRVQKSGLWDILPAAVASRVFGGEIYDDLGEKLKLNEYIIIPGNGVTVIKGEKFQFVKEKLKTVIRNEN